MSDQFEFHLPDVGEGIAEAELVEWMVAVGDTVIEDQAIVVIETDKSQLELPSPVAGTVTSLGAAEGTVVKVGSLLISIATSNARASVEGAVREPSAQADQADPGPLQHRETPTVNPADATGQPGLRPLASPSTRKLARSKGIDLSQIIGSGPHGRILAIDLDGPITTVTDNTPIETVVKATAPERDRSERTETVIELRGLRRQIANSMTEALRIPHVTEFREIDATAILAARATLKPHFERDGIRLSILPFLAKACAWALARNPSFNARFDADAGRLTQFDAVHLGIATSTDDGLIVPVLHDMDQLSLRQIAREIDPLAEAARTRKASLAQLSGGTFTLTNFGSFGTWLGTPIIHSPEVAIAGFGRIQDKVIAIDGSPAVRPVLPIVVAADHRINDGADLGALVSDIATVLLDPILLLDEA